MELQHTMTGKEKKYSCDRCGKGYQTDYKQNLLRHIRTIHEGNERPSKEIVHKCREVDWCNYQTVKITNLKRHIQAKHKVKTLKKCDVCEEFVTTSLELMKKHQLKHKNEVIPNHRCRLCDVSFTHNADFQSHLDSNHPAEKTFELVDHAFEKKLRIYKRNIRAKAVDTSCLWPIFKSFKNYHLVIAHKGYFGKYPSIFIGFCSNFQEMSKIVCYF